MERENELLLLQGHRAQIIIPPSSLCSRAPCCTGGGITLVAT